MSEATVSTDNEYLKLQQEIERLQADMTLLRMHQAQNTDLTPADALRRILSPSNRARLMGEYEAALKREQRGFVEAVAIRELARQARELMRQIETLRSGSLSEESAILAVRLADGGATEAELNALRSKYEITEDEALRQVFGARNAK